MILGIKSCCLHLFIFWFDLFNIVSFNFSIYFEKYLIVLMVLSVLPS